MKPIRIILFAVVGLVIISATNHHPPEKTIVLTYAFGQEQHWGDTSVVYYGYRGRTPGVNDSIARATGENYSEYTTMIIAQPSWILDSINFKPFSNLRTLILMGNDDDAIDSVRYSFFDLPGLKKITASCVYVNTATDRDYTWKGKTRFKNYVKGFRPDIRVKFSFDYSPHIWGN